MTLRNLVKKLPAILLLVGAITLLQMHAIKWWSAYDPATGWLWAVVIELGAVWLWSSRSKLRNGIAVFATALALLAPLYQLAMPLVEQHQNQQAKLAAVPLLIEQKRDEIHSLEQSLAQYNANSQHRAGWHGVIVSTQSQLTQTRTELAELRRNQRPHELDIALYLPVLMQIIGICLLQCLVVLSTRSLSQTAPAGEPAAAGSERGSQPNLQQTIMSMVRDIKNPVPLKTNAAAKTGRPAAV